MLSNFVVGCSLDRINSTVKFTVYMFQYFTSGANFEAGQFDPAMIGGTSAVADHCPLHFPLLVTILQKPLKSKLPFQIMVELVSGPTHKKVSLATLTVALL